MWYLNNPRGLEGFSFIKNIYDNVEEQDLCLVPVASNRVAKDDPYYPDLFWWILGFGDAGKAYAKQYKLETKEMNHASFKSECTSKNIYEVSSEFKLHKVRAEE